MIEPGFIDLHQHVLYGMDDGPETLEEMGAMLEKAAVEGIEQIFATVHADVLLRPKGLERYKKRLDEANAYCKSKGLALRVTQGCEIRYFDSVPDLLSAGTLLPLGHSRYVLLEFGHDVTIERIRKASDAIYSAGYLPILAHVERYACLVRNCRSAVRLREQYGLKYQVNCGSIIKPRSFRVRCFLRKMLEAQAVDVVASDAHDTSVRPVRMKAAYNKAAEKYGKAYAYRITHFNDTTSQRSDLR